MEQNQRKRIIYLDLMRAFAVLMMVQGHTVDALLSETYRDFNSPFFYLWHNLRGFTAPIFMFTSGVVFTYLLRLNRKPFFHNPRVKKGFIRFITLVTIGYLLRFPSFGVIEFTEVTHAQWMGFFTVDALHLIGFGILFILIASFFSEELKLKDYYVFGTAAIFFFIAFFFTEKIGWANYFPIPFAAYFYTKTGSYFPLFPWAGYVLSGAVLGSFLAKNPDSVNDIKFGKSLLYISLGFLITALIFDIVVKNFLDPDDFILMNSFYFIQRIGFVLLLNGILSIIALKLNSIPEIIKQIGTHTLLIYAVHVIILYGSAWIPGINLIFSKSFGIETSAAAAVIMICLMVGMVILLEKIKLIIKKKSLSL